MGDLRAEELERWVQRRSGRLTGVVRADGTLSLLEARGGGQRLAAVRPGHPMRVVVELERTSTGHESRRYLASVYQSDVLVEFQADVATADRDEPVMVEVSYVTSYPRRHFVVVEQGRRKVRWICRAKLSPPSASRESRPMRASGWMRLIEGSWTSCDARLMLSWHPRCGPGSTSVATRSSRWTMRASTRRPSWLQHSPRPPRQRPLRAASTASPGCVAGLADRCSGYAFDARRALVNPVVATPGKARSRRVAAPDAGGKGPRRRGGIAARRARSLPFGRGVLGRSRVRNDPGLTAISSALLSAVGNSAVAPRLMAGGVRTRLAELHAGPGNDSSAGCCDKPVSSAPGPGPNAEGSVCRPCSRQSLRAATATRIYHSRTAAGSRARLWWQLAWPRWGETERRHSVSM